MLNSDDGRDACRRKPLKADSAQSDGSIGSKFNADGSVGSKFQEVGGPLSADGAIGKQ